METDLIEPALLVDIKKITETRQIVAENGGFRIGAAVPGMEIVEHAAFCKAWPGVVDGVKLIGSIQIKGRAIDGRQSVQRLARRRQRAGPDRGRRDRPDHRPERHARGAGRDHSDRPRQDLARQGRDRGLVLPAAAAARIRATPICASRRAPRWTSRWSASASTSPSTAAAPARRRGSRSARWRRPCSW